MRILAIGDPHGDLKKIKKIHLKNIDLILLTGDLGSANLMRKMFFENINRKNKGLPEKKYSSIQKRRAFMEAYNSSIKLIKYLTKFAPVYVIFGNVESSNSETKKQSKKIGLKLPFLQDRLNYISRVKVINNRIMNFKGVKIGAMAYFLDLNWVKDFNPGYRKALILAGKETKKAKKILKKFGKVDILLCHQPPYGILDIGKSKFAPKSWRGKHAGSQTILNYLKNKQPDYVFCGHIHENPGIKKVGRTKVYNLGSGGYEIIEI